MKYQHLLEALVSRTRGQHFDVFARREESEAIIPIVDVTEANAGAVILVLAPAPRKSPASWFSIPPRLPNSLRNLLVDKTLVPPHKVEQIYEALIAHFADDDIPF